MGKAAAEEAAGEVAGEEAAGEEEYNKMVRYERRIASHRSRHSNPPTGGPIVILINKCLW